MIRFVDIHKRFGEHEVLRGVTLRVAPAGVHFILGKSGAGKTVLIKAAIGLVAPDRGTITVEGRDVTTLDGEGLRVLRHSCQLIFQNATLLDGRDVLDNVALPLRKRFALTRREADVRARAALAQVHAEGLASRRPSELGLGVRKRIAIARALALEPRVMLFDEPTTGLDPVAARRTDRLIRDMATRFGITAVVVSHDLTSVLETGDEVTFLHEGRVRFAGTPTQLWACADEVVKAFVQGERPRWSAASLPL